MEGKAALFKRFADIDAWPICLATQDTDEIVRAVEMIAPGFGGINLEDIAAPRCFEIEARLRESLDIPVFHDDQHGTAIVVLAALTNALRVRRQAARRRADRGLGRGRRGHRDRHPAPRRRRARRRRRRPRGAPSAEGDDTLSPAHAELAGATNPRRVTGSLQDVLVGADVFVGVSAPGILEPEWIPTMAEPSRSSSRSPTPTRRSTRPRPTSTPPWWPSAARTTPTRSTTCWPSPASSAACSTPAPTRSPIDMLLRAAEAIADTVSDEELHAAFIIPSVFHPDVTKRVAAAISGREG